ncbi:MAG: ATP-binding protein [Vicinamibacterales bacterium]
MADERTLTVPGRVEYLAQIADFITQAARDAGFDEDDVFHVHMAVDEACSNIIEHAYAGDAHGDISVTCVRETDGDLRVEICDQGKPFDPDQVPVPHIGKSPLDLDELRIGGLGLFFIRKLMDEVTFHFDEECGNTLTMVKRRPR